MKEVPGWPRLRLKDMLSLPSLVLRLREASPPTDQTEINFAKEDFTKLELIYQPSSQGENHLVGNNLSGILGGKGYIRYITGMVQDSLFI